MTEADIDQAAGPLGLQVLGAFHPEPEDDAGTAKTLVLLGPGPGFWDILTASEDFAGDDPVDRWSERVITGLADRLGARAIFPFGVPPYAPFIRWAKRTGRSWSSAVGLLVHDTTGLLVSYRGALAFDETLRIAATAAQSPCETCAAKPCLTACPVGALGAEGYDVPVCSAFLHSDNGADCMSRGCAVRRSCPLSVGARRSDAQSAHHMRVFRSNH